MFQWTFSQFLRSRSSYHLRPRCLRVSLLSAVWKLEWVITLWVIHPYHISVMIQISIPRTSRRKTGFFKYLKHCDFYNLLLLPHSLDAGKLNRHFTSANYLHLLILLHLISLEIVSSSIFEQWYMYKQILYFLAFYQRHFRNCVCISCLGFHSFPQIPC